MNPTNLEVEIIRSQLKHLIVELFRLHIPEPNKIPNDTLLLGGGISLDSLDALELGICIEDQFGVAIQSKADSNHAFESIDSLTAFIWKNRPLKRDTDKALSDLKLSPVGF